MKKAVSIALKLEAPSIDPLTDLILEQKKRLFEFIKKRVPEKEDAEDILQDVFFLFVQTSRSVKQIEHITSWLFRVAKNKIVDLYRKKKPEPITHLQSMGSEVGIGTLEKLENLDLNDPDTLLRKKQFWAEFNEGLQALPEKQREVFVWNEIDGLSFKEISNLTGVPINTLLSRKHYAILQLRKTLKDFKESELPLKP